MAARGFSSDKHHWIGRKMFKRQKNISYSRVLEAHAWFLTDHQYWILQGLCLRHFLEDSPTSWRTEGVCFSATLEQTQPCGQLIFGSNIWHLLALQRSVFPWQRQRLWVQPSPFSTVVQQVKVTLALAPEVSPGLPLPSTVLLHLALMNVKAE